MTSNEKTLKVDRTAGHESPDITERRRAEETLRKSEERYRALFTGSCDAMMTLEPPAWKFTSCNPACVKVFRTGDENRFVSTAPWELSPEFQPDGQPSSEAALAMIETALRRGSHFFEWRHRRLDGEEFPSTVLLTRVELEEHAFLQATVRDLTEQKRAEGRIAQLDRAQAILGAIDHAIVHIYDQQKLLDEICRVAVERGGFKLAWVGMIAPDGLVQPVAKCGATGYLDGIRVVVTRDEPEGRGPIGTAIRENRPVAIKNINLDPCMVPWRERAIKFGLLYAAVFPIRVRQKVAGSFQAYAPTADYFDENGLALLTQVSDDISFALATIADSNALKQSEQQLRKLSQAVEQSSASIVITDLTGAIEYVNPKFTRLTGYTADEVIGQNPRLLKSGEMPAETYQQLWQTITQGQEWQGQFHNRKKSGELFWEAASISPIKTADGKITHFVAVKEDITKRKKAEQALRESETRYRLISENVADVIFQMDASTGRLSYASPSVERLLGYTPEEALAKTMIEFLPPDSRKQAAELSAIRIAHFQTLPSGKDVHQDEFVLLRKDGSIIATEVKSTFMRNEIGGICIIAVVRDITESKQAEDALRQSEARFHMLANITYEGICISENGRICDVNDQLLKMFGCERDEMVGEDVLNFVAPDSRNIVAEAIRTDREEIYEHQMRRKDGSYFYVETQSKMMRVGNRKLRVAVTRDITERKRAQEALHQSQQRYMLAEHATNDGLWDWNILTDEEYFSPRWKEIIGYRNDELPNHKSSFLENIHSDDRAAVEAATRGHLEKGEHYSLEFRLRHKNGSYRWVFSRGGAQRDPAGRPVRMVGAITDITERKHVEKDLHEAEERFQLVTRAVKDSIWDWNLTSPAWWNNAFYEIYGFNRNHPPSLEEWASHVHPDDQERVMARLRDAVEHGKTAWGDEFHFKREDGTYGYVVTRSFSLLDASGKIVRMLGSMIDLTERKLAEKSIRENEERFRQLADSITDVFWIASPDLKKIHYVSPGYERIWGRTAESLYADPHQWVEAILPEDQWRANDILASLITGESANGIEYRIVRPDGSVRWVLDRSFQVRDAGGKVVRLTGVSTDITERKRLEGEILAERERLNREVLRRIELEQERIGRDLHDNLCQILVGAKYRTGVLEKLLSNRNVSAAAAEANEVEQMLNRSIQQARDLAKGLNPVTLKAQGLVISLKELAKEIEASGMARCRCQLSSTLLIADGDVVKHLYRIAQEAVQNAVKHGKARSISINLHEKAGAIVLTVEDDGVGFSANAQKTVGAGLQNMRMRALTIGGTLAIRPGQSGGTSISVSLPAKGL